MARRVNVCLEKREREGGKGNEKEYKKVSGTLCEHGARDQVRVRGERITPFLARTHSSSNWSGCLPLFFPSDYDMVPRCFC